MSEVPESGPSTPATKLGGYDFYRKLGSPKYVVAPMVDQSELVSSLWRRQRSRSLISVGMEKTV